MNRYQASVDRSHFTRPEHPFGTLKESILGNGRFLMRVLAGARTEISLAILAYNFKRVINILGTAGMANLLKA
jgi:hypothetical protein